MFEDTLTRFTDEVSFDEQMKYHTAFGVGGKAKYFCQVKSLYTLNALITDAKRYKVPYKVIGNGTNVLVSDKGFDGLIITTKRFKDVFLKVDEVKAMAGANVNDLLRFCVSHRMSGLEPLAGIPASIGGAVVMNAGAFGHNISDYVTTVETVDQGKIKKYYKHDCKFGYRKSRFYGKKETVTSVSFKFNHGERELIEASIRSFLEMRKKTQPTGKTCGSVFRNPKGIFAGKLIEDANLKGSSVGGAFVSEKHANFIVNEKNATATDVYKLIKLIKDTVREKYGILLKEEVEYIGEF